MPPKLASLFITHLVITYFSLISPQICELTTSGDEEQVVLGDDQGIHIESNQAVNQSAN